MDRQRVHKHSLSQMMHAHEDDESDEEPPETAQPQRLAWTRGLGDAAKHAARRIGDKALATLEDTLDAAEERLLEPEAAAPDDGRDPFDDVRVREALEQLKADAREELDLQKEVFEARIEELEACAASQFDGKNDRLASDTASTSDVVAVLCAAALRGAGVDDAALLSAELAAEPPRDASVRLEAAVAGAKVANGNSGDLDTLRTQFEAARKARDQESARLREEAQSARSLAATKAAEASEERKNSLNARATAAQAVARAEKAEARSRRVEERRRASEAACGAALAERDALDVVLQSRESTASASRRRLDAASAEADETAAVGRILRKRCEDAEAAAAAAQGDRERVEAARKNLERVVRSFEQKAQTAEAALKRDHALQLSEKEGDIEDAQTQIRELEARVAQARASEQARDVAAARAEAEASAARAAAQAAVADVAALKDVLLRPPDPVPVVEREQAPGKRRGFAAWLNEVVDAELGS